MVTFFFIYSLLINHFLNSPSSSYILSNIAINRQQSKAFVCQTPPAEGGRVLLKILDSLNTQLSPTIIVNKNFSGTGQNPDVVLDDSGTATVVWEQFIGSRIKIGLSRFLSNGIEIDSPQILTENKAVADQLPRIAIGKDGRFVVVWQALQAGIRGQLFSHSNEKMGMVFPISVEGGINPHYPSVKINQQNRIAIVWQEGSNDDFRILLRIFDWQNHPSKIVQVDNSHGTAYFSNPELHCFVNGNFAVTWKDYRTGEANIFQQIFTKELKLFGENSRINDDTASQWQRLPRYASYYDLQYAIVWEDYRNSPTNQIGDIYYQLFLIDGIRKGSNRKIEIINEPTSQRYPAAAMSSNGELTITWSDSRFGNSLIYCATVTYDGLQKGTEFQVFP
jgi:hypothetical protein